MKKAFTLIAALAVLAAASFAQVNTKRMTKKDFAVMTPAAMFKASQHKAATPVANTSAPKNVTSFPWIEDFESGTATGFTFIDADGDSFGWSVYDYGTDGEGHNGSNMMAASASWDNNAAEPLTPDNWMILPAIDIPATATDFELSWYEKGQDEDYSLEYYSVYISTTGATVADFSGAAVMSGYTTADWVKKTVPLGQYAGQTIYIAFRHHNVTDMFYINIDDIRIGDPSAPEVSVDGPAFAILGNPATFTAACSTPTVTWYVDGNEESETGNTLTYTFTTVGLHEVVVMATNVVGSTYDTINVNVVDCSNAINEFPYVEGFEGDLNLCWSFVSADPANDSRVGVTNSDYYAGSYSFTFSSYSTATDYNQFLITPELDLSNGDYIVGFWFKGNTASDAFRVKVSSTTNDTAAFTTVLGDFPSDVNTNWTYAAFQLPSNTKYVAINYYGDYAYYLWVDEFTIDEMGAPFIALSGDTYIGTGMEANYSAFTGLADTVEWFVDGDAVAANGNTMTYIFTTTGNHEVVAVASNNYGETSDTINVDVFSCDDITIPYIPDFTTGLGCWANRSDAEAGYGWSASVDMFDDAPEGQIISMSAQSILGFWMVDVLVDNWLTSPAIAMPANGNYEVAWSVKPFAPDYAGDHYGVYVIQGTDTTLLFEETLNSSMTDFVQRAVAIPASVTGDFKVAFRHHDNAGGYVIVIDDIQVRELTAPAVSITGPDFVETDVEVTFTATSGNADSYAWTVDGNAVSTTGNVLNYTFTTAGNHTVAVTGINVVGSGAPASLNVNVVACTITSLPYNQGFEDATISCWSFVNNIVVFNDPNYADYAHGGQAFLLGNYDDNADCDQWAISPAIVMPANATGIVFGYYVWMTEYNGIVSNYELRVSTTGSDPADFTNVIKHETGATDGYEYRGASLESFAGQTIRIAIHNITPAGGDAIFVDDITIGQGEVTGIEGIENANISIYPNPASDVMNIKGEGIQQVEVMDLNGRTVMTSAATSLNIENLASGIYMVRVVAAEGTTVEKIVKK